MFHQSKTTEPIYKITTANNCVYSFETLIVPSFVDFWKPKLSVLLDRTAWVMPSSCLGRTTSKNGKPTNILKFDKWCRQFINVLVLLLISNLGVLLRKILVRKSSGIRFCVLRPQLYIVISNLLGYRRIASRRVVNTFK